MLNRVLVNGLLGLITWWLDTKPQRVNAPVMSSMWTVVAVLVSGGGLPV